MIFRHHWLWIAGKMNSKNKIDWFMEGNTPQKAYENFIFEEKNKLNP